MRNRVDQKYERYWNYTAAFTDFNGNKFHETLETCVDFIDAHGGFYNQSIYSELQNTLQREVPVTGNGWDATQRKRINQLVKLGFIFPYLRGYPKETLDFLSATTNKKRTSVLSKIVYLHANFLNSTTNDINTDQFKFFMKSLEEIGSLNVTELTTLMTINTPDYPKGYITRQELEHQYAEVDVEDFYERKYNQVNHLKNVMSKLDDMALHDNVLYFKTDADRLFGDEETKKEVRDPYLQRVYKSELEEESCIHYECEIPRCMLEGLSHPVLIASHIKPYSHCKNNENERFDVNNGLLLSKSFDSLFDLGYITFNPEGLIIPSDVLSSDLKDYLTRFKLHRDFINPKRMEYMKYHNNNVFGKRFSTRNLRKYVMHEESELSIAAEE
jgi:hypothetical protein